ncbi:hypothetical protein M407DRAFT_33606 [Tulasnella calospora MUT 4182]|uniref:C2H2-type domain-containing protein n=1 Tax=Tulasnella calospora MUT 4182 TaxID=1051891 RepID=A0A0C3K5R8_9AGAM|nr:hypothetical protein M407DRAFT_33606 [Tulasnella calospora MUT 4182]
MLRHRCPNPNCPALKSPTAGFFKTEHSLQTHFGKSKGCFEHLIHSTADDQEMETEPALRNESRVHTEDTERDGDAYMPMESESNSANPTFRIEEFAGASLRYPVRVGTVWEKRKSKEAPGTHPYGPFRSAAEYDLAKWAVRTRQSLSSIDGLLNTRFASTHPEPLGFTSGDALRKLLESEAMPAPPRWKSAKIILHEIPDQPQTLYYRDLNEAIDYLFGNPSFAKSMDYAPQRIFEASGQRVYHEFCSGDGWWEVQSKVPAGTTIIPIILASDKTTLTSHTGGRMAHPLYLTLGNIRKDVRASIHRQAYLLLAYIPILSKIKQKLRNKTMKKNMPGILSKRLYHQCLSKIFSPLRGQKLYRAVDAEGFERETWRVLMSWIADMEEVWMILGLGHFVCPFCNARKNDLDSPNEFSPRTSTSVKQSIAGVRAAMIEVDGVERGSMEDTWSFAQAAKKAGLCGVEMPFWGWMDGDEAEVPVDIVKVMSYDLLHWCHKPFADYIVPWTQNIVDEEDGGESEIDLRLRLQIPRSGFRHFTNGISGFSQWTQGDTRDLEKEFLGAISGAPRATRQLLQATRSFLDYIYLATYPYHTESTLSQLDERTRSFEDTRPIYVSLGGRVSETTGEVIDSFLIPKLHIPRHITGCIRWKGTLDGSSTEGSERLHIDLVKEAWRASNHRDGHLLQMIRWVDLRERIDALELYLCWRDEVWPLEKAGEREGGGDGDGDGERERGEGDMVEKQMAAQKGWNVPDPILDNVDYSLNKRPHLPRTALGNVITLFEIPDFLADLLHYFETKSVSGIPAAFANLDVWTQFRILLPVPNDFMKPEWRRIRAQPAQKIFDTVLVNDGDAEVVGLQGYSVGELRLVFLQLLNETKIAPQGFTELERTTVGEIGGGELWS